MRRVLGGLAVSAMVLTGCVATQVGPTAKAQEDAIFACAKEEGDAIFPIQTRVAISLNNGEQRAFVEIEPTERLDAATAARINACAARALPEAPVRLESPSVVSGGDPAQRRPTVSAGASVGPSAETQIAVMEQCRAGFGVGGEADYQVDVGPARGGGRTANVLAVPFGQVTRHWADRINDCAAAQLEIIPLAAPVVADPDAVAGPCAGARFAMTRGTLYCRVGG